MQDKIWKLAHEPNPSQLQQLQDELGVNRFFALMLDKVGIRSKEEAKAFFNPELHMLHDPFLMKDMDKAVERIHQAKTNAEKIRVYGDYDVDGTTSVATVYDFLRNHFEQIDYYIPDRENEGYGISKLSIDDAASKGISLVIALDCGIRSVELVAYAQSLNIDFIICDHHLPGKEIPKTSAVLDPKRSDCTYPFKELSGCGIGFKLVQALCIIWKLPDEHFTQYLDIVAVSIASDLVPIQGENRVIASLGLKKLDANPSKGLQKIIDRFIKKEGEALHMDVMKVVFMIGPRINAAGRLGDAKVAVRMLLAESDEESNNLANQLNILNSERRELDKSVSDEALAQMLEDPNLENKFSTVVYAPEWHKGVVGIVASRILEKYYRPTIVLTQSGDKIVGSARSISNYNIHEALVQCSDLLIQFGGHAYAAGLKMEASNLEAFKARFESLAQKELKASDLVPKLFYDAEIPLSWANKGFVNKLKKFAPFGPGNQAPLFMSSKVKDSGVSKTMGSGHEHLRMNLISQEHREAVPAIAFGMSAHYDRIKTGELFSVLYHLDEQYFNGDQYIQLMVQDIKFYS